MFFLHINICAIRNNIISIKKRVKTKFCAVVKANAYGHGFEIAKYIDDIVDSYAVAWSCEAIELCRYTSKDIYVLNSDDDIGKKNIIYSAVSEKDLHHSRICVKINTGMNRNGIYPSQFKFFARNKNVYAKIDSIYTHFCSVEYAYEQFERFEKIDFPVKHCCASNCMALPGNFYQNMVRCGIAMYGYAYSLTPSMTAEARISTVIDVKKGEHVGYGDYVAEKNMRIAVVEAGYADGLRRGKNYFDIGGTVCETVGSVCMDVCMVDVENCENLSEYAVWFGSKLSVDDISNEYNTIPYEVLTGLCGRNRRIYETD